jgi:hypothetical protein
LAVAPSGRLSCTSMNSGIATSVLICGTGVPILL